MPPPLPPSQRRPSEELDPSDPRQARILEALALEESGALAEAEQAYRVLLRENLNDRLVLRLLGMLCERLGQRRDAWLAYTKLLTLEDDPGLRARVAELHRSP